MVDRRNASQTDSQLLTDTKNLKFDLLRQAFYHSDELAFYLLIERLTKFLSAMAGTAVVGAAMLQHQAFAVVFGFIITALQMADIVMGIGSKAVLHENKRERYFSLLADLESTTVSQDLILKVKGQMTREWEKEPVIFWGVDAVAYNSAVLSMTSNVKTSDLIRINWYEKLLRHLYRFDPDRFRRREYQSM